jgi:hypothetical protein
VKSEKCFCENIYFYRDFSQTMCRTRANARQAKKISCFAKIYLFSMKIFAIANFAMEILYDCRKNIREISFFNICDNGKGIFVETLVESR